VGSGALRYSPLFYGWYGTRTKAGSGYEIPLAYFLAMMAVYVLSFLIILSKMTKNNKQSKLTEKARPYHMLINVKIFALIFTHFAEPESRCTVYPAWTVQKYSFKIWEIKLKKSS
jgi:hypothetical protein